MREFSNNISQAFVNGLRPDARSLRSIEALYEAKNVRCAPEGMREPNDLNNPFGAYTFAYPFPQLIRGERVTLLCFETEINIVDTTTDPWTYLPIVVQKLDKTAGTIIAGGQWHFIDLGESWYLMNGSCVVFSDGQVVFEGDDEYYVDASVSINTGTVHNGRAFMGGLADDLWSNGWSEIFNNIKDKVDQPIPLSSGGIGKNTVMWSSVGAHDFPSWLFFPHRGIFSNISDELRDLKDINFVNTELFNTLNRNEFGFKRMPFQGSVLAMRPLGDGIVIYGEDGVTALTPFLSRDTQISTMAQRTVANFGILSRSAIAGDSNIHLFIDQKGKLWSINSELSLQPLGYEYLFSPLLNSNLTITYDSNEGDFYISSDTRCFLFAGGLTEVNDRITSGFNLAGDFNAMFTTFADDEILVTSSIFDFGYRGIKTITSLQMGAHHTKPLSVAVDYRFSDNESFSRTPFVPVNKEGGAVVRISGTDFRFVIKGETDSGFELDYMQTKWQASDKRQIRGTYVSPNDS